MDALVLERCVLLKEDQPAQSPEEIAKYIQQFKLD